MERIFRGKAIDTDNFIYGGIYEYNNKTFIVTKDVWDAEKNRADLIEVIPNTVGECIGFKDKNNQRIYERDVVLISKFNGETEMEIIIKDIRNINRDIRGSNVDWIEVIGVVFDDNK